MRIPKILGWILLLEAAGMLLAQNRIAAPIEGNRRAILSGHRHPRAQAQYDRGAVDSSFPLSYATIHFQPAASLDLFWSNCRAPPRRITSAI